MCFSGETRVGSVSDLLCRADDIIMWKHPSRFCMLGLQYKYCSHADASHEAGVFIGVSLCNSNTSKLQYLRAIYRSLCFRKTIERLRKHSHVKNILTPC